MRMKFLIGMALATVGLLVGCGGGGSGSSNNLTGTTRTLVGYVYVKSATNLSTTDPDVIVTPASTPPPGLYDVPISGTVTLIVQNGRFLLTPTGSNNGSVFTKNMADGNDIVVMVTTDGGAATVDITAGSITSGSGLKALAQYQENLNDGFAAGTTKVLSSPNNPDTRKADRSLINMVKFTLDGIMPSYPVSDIIAGEKRYLAIAYLDVNGIAIPGIPSIGKGVSIVVSDPSKLNIDTGSNLITTAKALTAGNVDVTVNVTAPSAVTGTLSLAYGFGAPKTIVIYRKTDRGLLTKLDLNNIDPILIRWDVVTNPRATRLVNEVTLVAEVTNKFGAPIPNAQVDWSDPKAPGNVWKTGSGGDAFLSVVDDSPTASSTTDINGQAPIKFVAPTPVDGPLSGIPGDANGKVDPKTDGDQRVKAVNYVFATVHGTTVVNPIPAKFFITRQFNSVLISEADVSKYMVLNAYSRVPYTFYGIDVDNWECRDTFVANFKSTPVPGGKKVGDPGERERSSSIAPTSDSTMEGNILNTGTKAGATDIVAYTDDVVPIESKPYRVFIWGPPTQIACVGGPVPYDPVNRPWEYFKVPNAINYRDINSQLVRSHFEPNALVDPTALVCYMYMGYYDSWGNGTAIPPTLPATDTFTATYIDPFNGGSISAPATPVGSVGSRCVIVTWGPLTGTNGEITITFTGMWNGVAANAPPPTTAVPFSISRKIRVFNGGG